MHINAWSMQVPVGIIGASGYSGVELSRLLAAHPSTELRFVTSDRWANDLLGSRVPDVSGPTAALRYVSNADGAARAKDCQVVFLATPAETSLELAPKLLALGARVVDLSGAFRLKDPALYP